MDTKTYQITKETCYKSDCNLQFDVIISSIEAIVANPVVESDFNASRENSKIKTRTVSDYIVVQCPDGHKQRVFINLISYE